MKTCVAAVLLIVSGICFSQANTGTAPPRTPAYPESDAAAAWRGLAAGYIRQALEDQKLNRDPALNARIDRVMAAVGKAVAAVDPRFAGSAWKAILIEDFGYGAAAFPGETILVDAKFLRRMKLNDDELALMLCHEAVHVIAGHASVKLTFMADFLGVDRLPTARTALLEFLAKDTYATLYRPTAQLQEREADELGAAVFFATGYDPQRALGIFDKLALLEAGEHDGPAESHDPAAVRKKAISAVFEELKQFHAGQRPG